MSTRSYNPRHRAPDRAPTKPRRFFANLALPTAAAAAVTFGATGAEVASSTRTVTATQRTASESTNQAEAQATAQAAAQAAATKAALVRDRRNRALRAQAAVRFRKDAAAKAARSAKRKDLAARALETRREALRVARVHAWQMPVKNVRKTSGFGWRWGRLHAGEDFAASTGTDLVSMSTGTVVFAGVQSGYGTLVKIRYWDGAIAYYAHMSRISVSDGERVAPGQVVGQSGNSGHSTGPHLHLEIHPDGGEAVDPGRWLAARNVHR